MSSVETIILRLIAMLDIIVSAIIPWLMGLAAAAFSICASLIVRMIVNKQNIM